MKILFIITAILISVLTWFMTSPKTQIHRLAIHRPIQRILRSVLIGIATYFVLVVIAMIYLYYANT